MGAKQVETQKIARNNGYSGVFVVRE